MKLKEVLGCTFNCGWEIDCNGEIITDETPYGDLIVHYGMGLNFLNKEVSYITLGKRHRERNSEHGLETVLIIEV